MSTTIEDQREKTGLWFTEEQSPSIKTSMELKAIHLADSGKSKYQKIDVIETTYGRTLVTDGKSQSAECDEFIYHESLVQPSLFLRGILDDANKTPFLPKTVFIGGGGELATAREVLRHSSVERCVMVDLDEEVINVSKKYLPSWGGNTCNDPRFDLIIGDANEYMYKTNEVFDLIIMDISDPIEAGPGIALYTQEFYQHCQTKLTKNGVFVTQAGLADCLLTHEGLQDSSFAPIKNTLDSVFDCAIPYTVLIPSYQNSWGFVLAFNLNSDDTTTLSEEETIEALTKVVSEARVNEMIESCIIGGSDKLRHYDGCTHKHMFSLIKSMRQKLMNDNRIMTAANPVFMY